MKRDSIFRFRLSAAEAERLQFEADERGLSKADLIRDALGWGIAGLTRPDPAGRSPSTSKSPKPRRTADTPGASGLAALQRRIAANRGT